jgi:DNA-binding GntR family transcriptional regulator
MNEQLSEIIKEKILLNEFSLGEQFNLRKLASEFSVSTIPVRDALFRLINEGLVENRSRIGFFVRSFSPKEISDIMEVRKLYELYCVKNYIDNIDNKLLMSCLKSCKKQKKPSRQEFDDLDEKIHDLFINASNNICLMRNYKAIKNQIIIFRHLDKDQIEVANQEHIKILQAILDGEKAAAVLGLQQHIDRVTRAIM